MDFKALSSAFCGIVLFPGSLEYVETTGSCLRPLGMSSCHPGLFGLEMAQLGKILEHMQSSIAFADIQLAVKGGGHTPWAGAASIVGGVFPDMRILTGTQVDPRTTIASLRAGERWRSVHETLGAQGMVDVGDRVPMAGVECLITGRFWTL